MLTLYLSSINYSVWSAPFLVRNVMTSYATHPLVWALNKIFVWHLANKFTGMSAIGMVFALCKVRAKARAWVAVEVRLG